MPEGLNPIVKRYLKGTVESRGKDLTWETDDHGFLFVIDGKYYEVPYKEFLYEGPDQFIQLTHDAVIDRSIVGIYRTIAGYCTELLLHPETFAYYDQRLVSANLGRMLSGEITTDKGKFKWRVTSESVEIDCRPRVSMMYVSHKYYTSEIWALLAPDIPYNVCQMFVILGNLYIRCVKFDEPEVILSLEEIKHNIMMRKEAERRQKLMEEQKRAEEARRREASARKFGGGVDIGLGSGGGVDIPRFGEEQPQFEKIPLDGAPSPSGTVNQGQPDLKRNTGVQIELQPQAQVQVQAQIQPELQPQAQVQAEVQPELQPQAQIQAEVQPQEEVQVEIQPQAQVQAEVQPQSQVQVEIQPQVQVQAQIQPQAQIQAEVQAEIQPQEEVQVEVQPQAQVQAEVQPQEDTDKAYMDAIMQYLEDMDLPTKNPERSIKKYYPEWALAPIKDLTGDAFLQEFAKML